MSPALAACRGCDMGLIINIFGRVRYELNNEYGNLFYVEYKRGRRVVRHLAAVDIIKA